MMNLLTQNNCLLFMQIKSYFEDQIVNKRCNSQILIVDRDHSSESSCLPSVSGTETFNIDQGQSFEGKTKQKPVICLDNLSQVSNDNLVKSSEEVYTCNDEMENTSYAPTFFVANESVPVADPGISKREGAGRSRCGRIFRSGVCFDAPSHIPYLFVARVVNKINIVNIVY